MDKEVKQLLQCAVKNLISLEVTLFFHTHPEQASDLQDLCCRLGSEPEVVKKTLKELAGAGIVECAKLGAGRYEIYSYTHDPQLRSAIERLSCYYHDDPRSRAEIIRHIISHSISSRWRQERFREN